jgi:hypothetical protein
MLVRFRQTAAGLQCSLVETRRLDGTIRYEHVASLGSVPASPSVADRLAFWRRTYEQLAALADRIDAETQGKIISAVHARIPIVIPNEQRALRARPRPQRSAHVGVKERPQTEAPTSASSGTDADSTIPFPHIPSLPIAENKGTQTEEHAEMATEGITRSTRGENVGSGLGAPSTAEQFRTILLHLLHYIRHSVRSGGDRKAPEASAQHHC